ncbi:unnamed protein product, partial [Vitis vinifera]
MVNRGLLILTCFFSFVIQLCLASKTRHFKWEVEYMYWSPDCMEGVVMGINGQFPGPTIRAVAGDTIVVELTNRLHTEGVVIHWHGIRQFGTPWADGTASISQCAINPGETFIYRYKVDKAGTYFYHGHYGMQRSAGLYGSLVVEVGEGQKEPFHYDGEFNLLLSDWWHKGSQEQEVALSSKPFRWIGEPQTLLINGRGQYNCSLAAHVTNSSSPQCQFRGNEQCSPQILHVQPHKTYRLRVSSTTALASLNLQIGNHKMVMVEADGNYIQPVAVDDLDIYSGESYSVLIHTDQDPSKNYWISVSVRGREPKTPQGLTILNYQTTSASKLPTSTPPVSPLWNDYNHSKSFSNKILALMGSPKPPTTYNRRIILLNTQNTINGFTKWAINNISLTLPPTPYLGVSEIHPWHLHGHDFWVLGYGEGKFREKDAKRFNLKNPPLRNTAVIFPFGWTALRFVADNPGVWAFHCHIEPHLHMGMGVVFAEGVHLVKDVPNHALACGLTGKMLMSNYNSHLVYRG